MEKSKKNYINGEFITPHGTETFDLINPSNNIKIREVILTDETDTRKAISTAKEAFKTFPQTTVSERIHYVEKLKSAVEKREQDLIKVMIKEYGGKRQFATMSNQNTVSWFNSMLEVLKNFEFKRNINSTV